MMFWEILAIEKLILIFLNLTTWVENFVIILLVRGSNSSLMKDLQDCHYWNLVALSYVCHLHPLKDTEVYNVQRITNNVRSVAVFHFHFHWTLDPTWAPVVFKNSIFSAVDTIPTISSCANTDGQQYGWIWSGVQSKFIVERNYQPIFDVSIGSKEITLTEGKLLIWKEKTKH